MRKDSLFRYVDLSPPLMVVLSEFLRQSLALKVIKNKYKQDIRITIDSKLRVLNFVKEFSCVAL